MRPELAQGPRRAALALPNTPVADAVAHGWGEAVWTHPTDWRIAVLTETPVTLADLRLGRPDPRPPGCTCTVAPGCTSVLLVPGCARHGHLVLVDPLGFSMRHDAVGERARLRGTLPPAG